MSKKLDKILEHLWACSIEELRGVRTLVDDQIQKRHDETRRDTTWLWDKRRSLGRVALTCCQYGRSCTVYYVVRKTGEGTELRCDVAAIACNGRMVVSKEFRDCRSLLRYVKDSLCAVSPREGLDKWSAQSFLSTGEFVI